MKIFLFIAASLVMYYCCVVFGLYIQASNIQRFQKAKKFVWRIPIIYILVLFTAVSEKNVEDKRQILKVLILNPIVSMYIVTLFVADLVKEKVPVKSKNKSKMNLAYSSSQNIRNVFAFMQDENVKKLAY